MSEEVKSPPELTLLQKIALEGEVSSQYDSYLHEADKILKTYFMLKFIPDEFRAYYYAECAKYVSEDILESCMSYINKNVFPVSFITNRFISDIKMCLRKEDNCSSYQIPFMSEGTIKSKFAYFVTEFLQVSPKLTNEFLYSIITSNDPCLDFLKDVAFLIKNSVEVDMGEDLDKLRPLPLLDLLQSSIMHTNLLSFSEETQKAEGEEDNTKVTSTENATNIFPTNNIEPEHKIYQVNKIDKSTGRAMQLKEFTSQSEAINFVKEINHDYPELSQRYKFTITIGDNKE